MIRALGLVIALLATWVTPGAAHQTLLRATPAVGDQLRSLPTTLRLIFREPIQGAFTRITLVGPDSVEVTLGTLVIEGDSGTVAALPIAGRMGAGAYTVAWRTTGADGHTVEDRYTFTVLDEAIPDVAEAAAEPDEMGDAVPPQASSTLLQVESSWYVLVRWLGFLALLGVLGAAMFVLAVLPTFGRGQEPPGQGLRHQLSAGVAAFGRVAALGVLLAGLGRLVAQGATMLTPTDPVTLAWLSALVGGTMWGKGWLLQMTAGVVAWIGFRSLERRNGLGVGLLILLAALGLALTPALSGHAIATIPRTGIAVAADWAHVLAAGGWMGGLAVLLLVGLPVIHRQLAANRASMIARLVQAFSPPALLLGGVVVATGLVGAWLHLGSLAALWSAGYGQTLIVKLALVAILFALGGINFLRVRPSLGTDAGTATLRRSAGAELTIGIVVLVVTAILVALPPASATSHASSSTKVPVAISPSPED